MYIFFLLLLKILSETEPIRLKPEGLMKLFWTLLKQYKNKTKTICGECVDRIIIFLRFSNYLPCPKYRNMVCRWPVKQLLFSLFFFFSLSRVYNLIWNKKTIPFPIKWKSTRIYFTLTSNLFAWYVHFKAWFQWNGDDFTMSTSSNEIHVCKTHFVKFNSHRHAHD